MARARQPQDWENDLAAARDGEQQVSAILRSDIRIANFVDRTNAFDELDFGFDYRGMPVSLDLKEKRQPYNSQYSELMPRVEPKDLFIVDEVVYRRIIWQGGGGYLAINDQVTSRWIYLGAWDLTLAPKMRYGRRGQRHSSRKEFVKGKLLINLGCSSIQTKTFEVDALLKSIDQARSWQRKVEPYPVEGITLREIG
jgi:hypothetical protein